MDEKIRGRTL